MSLGLEGGGGGDGYVGGEGLLRDWNLTMDFAAAFSLSFCTALGKGGGLLDRVTFPALECGSFRQCLFLFYCEKVYEGIDVGGR